MPCRSNPMRRKGHAHNRGRGGVVFGQRVHKKPTFRRRCGADHTGKQRGSAIGRAVAFQRHHPGNQYFKTHRKHSARNIYFVAVECMRDAPASGPTRSAHRPPRGLPHRAAEEGPEVRADGRVGEPEGPGPGRLPHLPVLDPGGGGRPRSLGFVAIPGARARLRMPHWNSWRWLERNPVLDRLEKKRKIGK